MKIRKIMSMILLLGMLALVSCGQTPEKTSATTPSLLPKESEKQQPAGPQIKVLFHLNNPNWYGIERIIEHMQDIIYDDTGINTEMTVMSTIDFLEKDGANDVELDKYDIQFRFNPGPAFDDGKVLDLTPFLANMPYIVETIGNKALDEMRYKGALVGIPVRTSTVMRLGMALSTDLLLMAGYSDRDLEHGNFDQLSEILMRIHDLHPEMDLITGSTNDFLTSDLTHVGTTSSGYFWGVLMKDNPDTFVNYFESDDFLELARYMKSWYEAGYVQKDIEEEMYWPLELTIDDGKAAGQLSMYSPESEQNMKLTWPKEASVFYLRDGVMQYPRQSSSYSISASSENPEQAAAVLDYMFQSRLLNDTMLWGIEDKNWVESGVQNVAQYPEGLDQAFKNHNYSFREVCFNPRIAHVFTPLPGNFYTEIAEQAENEAYRFPSFGFSFDDYSEDEDLTAAFRSISKDYLYELLSGHGENTEELIKRMNKELIDAGLNDYIAIKQKALDDWMAKR